MKANELLELLEGLKEVRSTDDMEKFLSDYKKSKEEEDKDKKYVEYSKKISKAILELFVDEDSPNHISLLELHEKDNGDQFVHALANIAPAVILDAIADEDEGEDMIDRHNRYLRLILKYSRRG